MSVSTSQPTSEALPLGWMRDLYFLFPAIAASVLGVWLLAGVERDYLEGILAWQKQAVWVSMGVVIALVVSRFPIRPLVRLSPTLYGVNLVLLFLVLLAGIEKGGAHSWIDIGPFAFQPSEPMKIVVILLMARLLQCERGETVGFSRVVLALVLAALPAAAIAFQPDLGTAMIFPPILLAALYGARVPRRYLSLVLSPLWALIVSIGDTLAWCVWGAGVGLWLILLHLRGENRNRLIAFFVLQCILVAIVAVGMKPLWKGVLKQHQRDRLVGFLNRDEVDAREMSPATYHLHQSLIAISSGGVFGQGRGQGLQSTHGFIPMMRTDFIFAVLAEEMGFVGCLVLFGLFTLLLLRGVRCTAHADTWIESAVVFGILGMWCAHIFINLGMTMGLSPITGIPLPFVSYGGTSTLSNYLALGMVLSVHKKCRIEEYPLL